MTLTPEQFNELFGLIILLGGALAGYLNYLSRQTKSQVVATNQNVDALHAKLDTVIAAVAPSPVETVAAAATDKMLAGNISAKTQLVDGHEIPHG